MSERITWNKAIVFALMGTLVATACVVSSDDSVDDDDGESGGASSKGGKTSTGGKSGTGGSTSDGGAATSDGGTTTTSAGGTTTTEGGSESTGTGGTGTEVIEYTCDDGSGGGGGYDAVGTPADSCEPSDSDDECQTCIQESCCDSYKECIGSEPYNVCGWGGPDEYQNGAGGEFVCFVDCINEAYDPENDVIDEDMQNECFAACATCDDIIGTETLELAECTVTNCDGKCYY